MEQQPDLPEIFFRTSFEEKRLPVSDTTEVKKRVSVETDDSETEEVCAQCDRGDFCAMHSKK